MDYVLINDTNFESVVPKILDTKEPVVFDTETTGLSYDSDLLGISLYNTEKDLRCFIPTDTYFSEGLSLAAIRKGLDAWNFKDSRGVAHNAKYDICVLTKNRIVLPQIEDDTLLMVHCYDPLLAKNLEERVSEDFDYDKPTFAELIGKKWDKVDWHKEGDSLLHTLAEYACDDGYWTYEVKKKYEPLLEEDNLIDVYRKIELRLVHVLSDMYLTGVSVNVPLLHRLGNEIKKEMKSLTNEIYDIAGAVFNMNSSQQKAAILFDKMGMPVQKKTKTGRSTDAETLEILAELGYPLAQSMVEYGALQKLKSGYTDAIPAFINADGKLRCNFNSTGTKTGRFSSDTPNLQNQPNNSDFPIRQAFIPSPDFRMFGGDYSQIELRVMGHASKDERFCNAFNNGEDIHSAVARDLDIPRKGAKTINFGVLYGMGEEKLARALGLPVLEARKIIKGYNTTYKGYTSWKAKVEYYAKQNGYVKTLYGRIRRLPELRSENKKLYYGGLRRAVNTVIQGTSADIIKMAMIRVKDVFNDIYISEGIEARLLLQVHDELIGEAAKGHEQRMFDVMKDVMENIVKLRVPLVVEGKVVSNWNELKEDTVITVTDREPHQEFPYYLI